MSENLENRINSTQAKDAIYKAHSINSSASEIDAMVENIEARKSFYGVQDYSIFNKNGGDLSETKYSTSYMQNLPSSQLKSIDIFANSTGILNLFVVRTINGNPRGVEYSYETMNIEQGLNTYLIDDDYIIDEGSSLYFTSNAIMYNTTSSGTIRIPLSGNYTTSTVGAGISFILAKNTIIGDVALTKEKATSLYLQKTHYIGSSIRKVKIDSGSKIQLFGDSISSSDYTWYATELNSLTGATVNKGGYSGATAAALTQSFALSATYTYNADVIICLIGGNDNGEYGTVGTFGRTNEPIVSVPDSSTTYRGTYFIQAVSYIMQNMKNYYYDIRTRASLTGTETEAEKTAKIDAVKKPLIVFCTPLPQKRVNDTYQFSMSVNWERKRQAIIECCEYHDMPCIDLFKKFGVDMTKEPYWNSPTNKTTNNGIYTMDGLHPNKYGYRRIAEIVASEIMI